MRRRDFLPLFGALAVGWPLSARAQQPALPVMGYLSSKGEAAEAGILAAVRQGLAENGFVEGRNVTIAYLGRPGDACGQSRNLDNTDCLPARDRSGGVRSGAES